jgi:hypothetical protein
MYHSVQGNAAGSLTYVGGDYGSQAHGQIFSKASRQNCHGILVLWCVLKIAIGLVLVESWVEMTNGTMFGLCVWSCHIIVRSCGELAVCVCVTELPVH